MPSETGGGDRSDHHGLWVRILTPGSGSLRRLSAEQRCRYEPQMQEEYEDCFDNLFISRLRAGSAALLQLLRPAAGCERRHGVFCVCHHEQRGGRQVRKRTNVLNGCVFSLLTLEM